MELYQLRTFVAVAEEGHLTRAAGRVHASQSTVSAQIKALEDELGLALFERTPRGMRLTPGGQELLGRAREALASAQGLLETARALRGQLTGTAHVGLNTCPDLLRGARLMAVLRREHPGVQVRFSNTMSHRVLADVAAGDLDAGYVFGTFSGEFDALTVMRTPMRVVGPVAWAGRLAATACDGLAALPWVWTPPECPFTQVAEALFPERDRCPEKAAVADDESVVLALVEAGHGLALMREPEALAAAARGAVALHPHSPGTMALSFVTSSRRAGEGLVRALAGAVREVWGLPAEAGAA
ncbi:LysR family transcriptional regulator [Desulfocurvus vexinensis]|uniref:LysR family transcriptional regulator n=1 Tax=Desulfocurvus vexinensis TaxID=399548 RepID=UPI00048A7932|nr:LysR family transcriptional regulator [Desulfocurvus vexinensis]